MKSKRINSNHKNRAQETEASHSVLEQLDNERTRLYLVRHGELTTSQEWRYVGHLDVELNDTGIEQVERLSERLAREEIHTIIASDLKRTAKSAAIIGEKLKLQPVYDRDFREINIGRWEGMTMNEIVKSFPDEFQTRSSNLADFRVEAGESFVDVRKRVIPRLSAYLEKHQGKNILIVAHGGVNRVILCHALGIDLNNLVRIDQSYACLNIIDYFDGVPVVRLVNETV